MCSKKALSIQHPLTKAHSKELHSPDLHYITCKQGLDIMPPRCALRPSHDLHDYIIG